MTTMESHLDWHAARALLDWHVELGVDEAISDTPVDRFATELAVKALQATVAAKEGTGPGSAIVAPALDVVAEAQRAAAGAADIDALRAALSAFPHCELQKGARNLVFADGTPGAQVMIVGDAPDRDEDISGKPFAGRAGQLLDKMLAAIGLNRGENVYLTNVMPWRPPQGRDPRPEEIAMMLPFVQRHIVLARPQIVVVMGNHAARALLEKTGITRLRGVWHKVGDLPALPMLHPDYLMRNSEAKRDAWADLLALKARLATLK